MSVYFKIYRQGKRYMPKQLLMDEDKDAGSCGSQTDDQKKENVTGLPMNEDKDAESSSSQTDDQQKETETGANFVEVGDKVADHSIVPANPKPGVQPLPEDLEVSFALNLFPDGFSVGKAAELLNDVPKMLHPYDRASDKLFSAIEHGYLPGDFFDDLPCKYVNGALLCEIRDFRNCLVQMEDSTFHVEKSPIVQKALLKMSMENVIKDISSMSDDSWTYKDHLEVESRILKAMQPGLSLNPKQDIFSGESMTKKLNLEIPWNSKKRKLIDTSETGTESSIAPASGVGDTQNDESPPSLAFQDGGASYSQKTIPSSNPHLGENNTLQEAMLPKQYVINHPSSPREPGTLVLSEKDRCKKQTQGPILKKPKEEPVEFSPHQLSVSQSETILAPETQQKEKQLRQSCDSEKILNERLNGEKQSSPKMKDGQQVNLEGIPKLQSGVLAHPVKQESESSKIPRSDIRHNDQKSQMHQLSSVSKINDPANSIQPNDMGKPFAHERIHLQKPLVSTAVGSAPVNVSSSHRDSLLRESSVLGKRKLNSHPEGLSMNIVESLPSIRNMNSVDTSSCPVGNSSSPWPLGTKEDPLLKRFSKIEMVTQRYGLHYRKRKVDKFLDKKPIFKTSLVSYHLDSEDNNLRAGNTDGVLQMRTLNFVRPSHFYKGNEPSVDVSETQTKLVLSKKLKEGTVEGRVLYGQGEVIDSTDFPLESTFVSTHEIDKFAAQFVSLMAREGFFLAGDKIESSPGSTEQGSSSQPPSVSSCATPDVGTVMPPSPTPIPGKTPYMFSSLTRSMQTPKPRQLPSQDFLTGGHLRQRSVNISGATSATGTEEPPSPTLVPGQSAYMFSSVTSSMPVLNPSQLPSQNFLTGAHLLPSRNIQSALQPSANYSSNPLLNNAAQVSPLQLHWQQIINNSVRLQFQMQQRERQQQQLMQSNIMMRGLPAASSNLGMTHLGVGIQGSRNTDLGYLSNFMDIGGPSSVSMGGHVPRFGNLGQVNNLGSNILGFNGSSQIHGGISQPSDAAIARMMVAQSQQRPLLRGVPVQSNAGLAIIERSTDGMARQPPIIHTNSSRMAMHPPILPDQVVYNMSNQQLQMIHRNARMMPMHPPLVPEMVHNFLCQQPPSAQIHQQLHITQLQLQYQRMNPPFPGQSSLQEHSHQHQMNPQLQVHAGNPAVAPESVELSFPRVGSGGGSNESSTMAASDESGDISSEVNTGGI
ncbi:hypothetical protein VitviT2T_000354 [Vitis vinifera]|uniref:Uncharacterized protein n=1 Tax=Vitis vinifera TaxID=29760 RepID=A0ABY9BDL9_VITVI|nr:protein PHYTOCHROME-DEPENDENT LATE-FLOWERING isoform X3 [Vitis vinifera]WJZ80435.1 hypothetical protein VitviT2T_000354 [Vitis vinifera]|eukprot:XP_010662340.1 PREDICTED: uncharacterized protein LOC104882088 isoform X3 [Vitis vinifera]